MKALFVYSRDSGRKDFQRSISYVRKKLSSVFETMDFCLSLSVEDSSSLYESAAKIYDALIIVGGDGTFHHALNVLMTLKRRPILGFINHGTLGDVGKSFGVRKSLRSAIKVLKKQNIKTIDVGKLETKEGNYYFAYCAAFGTYSDLSYVAKRGEKKHLGPLAYYLLSLKQIFQREKIDYRRDGEKKKVSFSMVLNGKWMGGFKINSQSSLTDGVFELYEVSGGAFNGLLKFLPFKRIKPTIVSSASFTGLSQKEWCLDGEKGPKGDAKLQLIPHVLRVFSL